MSALTERRRPRAANATPAQPHFLEWRCARCDDGRTGTAALRMTPTFSQ